MMVNNELGSVLPVGEVSRIIKRKKAPALLHCDAVQAFGKLPVNVKRLGVDLLTVSSHKIHGPKGAGALFIKKGVRIVPRTYGGLQESSIRCGTEGLPAIAGFGAAAGEMEFDGTAASPQHVSQTETRNARRRAHKFRRGRDGIYFKHFGARHTFGDDAALSRFAGGIRVERLGVFKGEKEQSAGSVRD